DRPTLAKPIARRLGGKAARTLGRDSLQRCLGRLREQRTRVLCLFAELEPQLHELERDGYLARLGRWPTLRLERLPGRDHTLRPRPMQEAATSTLDRLLSDLLRETESPSV